jgi:hypothetical protein
LLCAAGVAACAHRPTLFERANALTCPAKTDSVEMVGAFAHPQTIRVTPGLTFARAYAIVGGQRESYEILFQRCGYALHVHRPHEIADLPLRAGDRFVSPDPASIY